MYHRGERLSVPGDVDLRDWNGRPVDAGEVTDDPFRVSAGCSYLQHLGAVRGVGGVSRCVPAETPGEVAVVLPGGGVEVPSAFWRTPTTWVNLPATQRRRPDDLEVTDVPTDHRRREDGIDHPGGHVGLEQPAGIVWPPAIRTRRRSTPTPRPRLPAPCRRCCSGLGLNEVLIAPVVALNANTRLRVRMVTGGGLAAPG